MSNHREGEKPAGFPLPIPKDSNLSGQVALIAGLDNPQTIPMAVGLAQRGVTIILLCPHEQKQIANQIATLVHRYNQPCTIIASDNNNEHFITAVAQQIRHTHGRLDILLSLAQDDSPDDHESLRLSNLELIKTLLELPFS